MIKFKKPKTPYTYTIHNFRRLLRSGGDVGLVVSLINNEKKFTLVHDLLVDEDTEKSMAILDKLEPYIQRCSAEKLKYMIYAIEAGVDLSPYILTNSAEKLYIIYSGLVKGYDITKYCTNEYNIDQMRMVNLGVQSGHDVSMYNNVDLTWDQMNTIYQGIKDGLDVFKYADPKYSTERMRLIKNGLHERLDTSHYSDINKYDDDQAEIIYRGLRHGIDISQFTKPHNFTAYGMRVICDQLIMDKMRDDHFQGGTK